MKKTFPFLLVIILLITACQSQSAPAPPSIPAPTETPTILVASKEPRICQYEGIAFIGGSITAGAGASKGNSYASKVGNWFISNCSYEINIKNISIGGTGSDFAAYRLEHDLGGFVPDIVFYEFAVNDGSSKDAYITKHVEALIYKLRRINPDMLIFSILTTKANQQQFYTLGNLPPTTNTHLQVAIDNNIPVINVGQSLWAYIAKNDEEIEDYLRDGVHPNDAGHQLYSETIIQFLNSYFNMSAKQYEGGLANATLIDMSEIASASCEKVDNNSEIYLLCDKGDSFSAVFSGDVLGIVGRIRSDGGRLECVVDDSKKQTLDFWDGYALSFNRTNYFFPFDNLGKTNHQLTCTVLDEIISNSNGQSQGTIVKILYFMVNPE